MCLLGASDLQGRRSLQDICRSHSAGCAPVEGKYRTMRLAVVKGVQVLEITVCRFLADPLIVLTLQTCLGRARNSLSRMLCRRWCAYPSATAPPCMTLLWTRPHLCWTVLSMTCAMTWMREGSMRRKCRPTLTGSSPARRLAGMFGALHSFHICYCMRKEWQVMLSRWPCNCHAAISAPNTKRDLLAFCIDVAASV